MPVDIYSTLFMAKLIREKPTLFRFFLDRYFADTTIYKADRVIVDYDDGEGNMLAPFVIPRVGRAPMMRGGYQTHELSPANIAPSRTLTVDDAEKRRAGESIVSTMTPEQRARQMLMDDLEYLDRAITRTEEWMCVNTMLDNACTMKHIGDSAEKGIDMTVQFYEGKENPGVFKPSAKWEIGTETKRGTWYDDVAKQAASLADAGRPVSDLVVGAEVSDMILSDPWVYKMLDNRRAQVGEIDPRWQENGVVVVGNLNFSGIPLNIFCYRGSYEERDAKDMKKFTAKPYFPTKGALLAAPKTGNRGYGQVTQMENDFQMHTRQGTRVSKVIPDVAGNVRELVLTARPVAAPNMKGMWRACRDVLTA